MGKMAARLCNHPKAQRLRQLGETIPEAQAEVDVMKIVELSREDLLTETRDLYESWQTFDHDQKRHIIETITDRIMVGKDEVTISLIGLSTPGSDDPDDRTPPPTHPLNSRQHGNATPVSRRCAACIPPCRPLGTTLGSAWPRG